MNHVPILAGAFLFLAADARLYESAPLAPVPTDYTFYHQIGAEQGEPYDKEVVLEVPTGAATGDVILGDPRATQLAFMASCNSSNVAKAKLYYKKMTPDSQQRLVLMCIRRNITKEQLEGQ